MSQDDRRLILGGDGLCLSVSSKNVFAWKIRDLKFSTEDRGIREINVLDNKNTVQKIA